MLCSNVSTDGGVNAWSPRASLEHVLLTIQSAQDFESRIMALNSKVYPTIIPNPIEKERKKRPTIVAKPAHFRAAVLEDIWSVIVRMNFQ